MNSSMINASVTMTSLQKKLDLLGNNIANLDTAGYKRQDVSFVDVLTAVKSQQEQFELAGRRTPNGVLEAWGARLGQTQIDFSQGPLKETNEPLDIALSGNALIEIAEPQMDGEGNPVLDVNGNQTYARIFTRGGAFHLTPVPDDPFHAHMATDDGHVLRDRNTNEPIRIPSTGRVTIDSSGNIFVETGTGRGTGLNAGDNGIEQNGGNVLEAGGGTMMLAGQIPIVQVKKPQMLLHAGGSFFALPAGGADNIVQIVDLNIPGAAEVLNVRVHQGFIEQSNVVLADEMTEAVSVQRAFQLSARALSSADQMMGMANHLRG